MITLVSVLLAVLQVVLGFFGIGISKDGVNINWRRLLLWAAIAPIVALVASRIFAVFSDCIYMFRGWSGSSASGTFYTGLVPLAISKIFPTYDAYTGTVSTVVLFCYNLSLLFAADRIVGLSLQILGVRILLKNSERLCSAITATIHTTISVMSK